MPMVVTISPSLKQHTINTLFRPNQNFFNMNFSLYILILKWFNFHFPKGNVSRKVQGNMSYWKLSFSPSCIYIFTYSRISMYTLICWLVVDASERARMCYVHVISAHCEISSCWREAPLDSSGALVRCSDVQGGACSGFYRASNIILHISFRDQTEYFLSQASVFAIQIRAESKTKYTTRIHKLIWLKRLEI